MSPDELKSLVSNKPVVENKRYQEYLELMCNPAYDIKDIEEDLERDDKANAQMSPAEYQDHMDVSLSLSMNLCPKCLAPVFQEPLGANGMIMTFSCTRFSAEHTWVRSVPLLVDSSDFDGSKDGLQ